MLQASTPIAPSPHPLPKRGNSVPVTSVAAPIITRPIADSKGSLNVTRAEGSGIRAKSVGRILPIEEKAGSPKIKIKVHPPRKEKSARM